MTMSTLTGRTLRGMAMVAAAVIAAGCADLVLPAPALDLPDPDPSLDPARLSVGDYIATPCGLNRPDGFAELEARDEWALVDVYFGRASEHGPWGAPTSDDVRLVQRHGGHVVHRYNIPAVRAHMNLSRIPAMVADGFWVTVRDVPDASRYDVPLSIGFDRPLTDEDLARFVEAGGRIDYRWDFIDAIAGVLPDRSIPLFQERDDVAWVQAESVACTGG
jgi:hypothetical protein